MDSSNPALPSAVAGTVDLTMANHVYGGMGANHLIGDAGANTLRGGMGDDTLAGDAGADTLEGGAGEDVVSYAADMTGVTVDLSSATAQAGGDAVGDILSGIEHAMGGNSNDRLTGSGGANSLLGGAGADTLTGGAGADNLLGGADDDAYVFADMGSGADRINDGGGAADVASFDGMDGHLYLHFAQSTNDLVVTNLRAATDTVTIEDFFSGTALGAGAIEMFQAGGKIFAVDGTKITALVAAMGMAPAAGTQLAAAVTTTAAFTTAWGLQPAGMSDIVDLSGESGGFMVDLAMDSSNPALPSAVAATVDLTMANHVYGGMGANHLIGDAGANTLRGGMGDDTLAGDAGADTLEGGAGEDVVSYAADMVGVTVDVSSATAQAGGDAVGDILSGIEHAMGGNSNDRLTGSGGANSLLGGAGNDTLTGGAGADNLLGGADDDSYVFADMGSGADRINDAGGAADVASFDGMDAHTLSAFRTIQ